MHELEITQHILADSIREAERHGAKAIREIRLAIGPFSGFVPECIQMYMDVLAEGTIAQGARIKTRIIPLRVLCQDCGETSQIDRTHIECPHCHEKAPAFVSPDHERAWIIRTTANTCKDLLKSHWRKTTAPLEAAAAVPAPQPEEGSLLAAVNLLPPQYRQNRSASSPVVTQSQSSGPTL